MDSVFRDVTYQYKGQTNDEEDSSGKESSNFAETKSDQEYSQANNIKSMLNIFNLKVSNDSLGKKNPKHEISLEEDKENLHPNSQLTYDLNKKSNITDSKYDTSVSEEKSESEINDDSKTGQDMSTSIKNKNILNRISLAEKSLNNFCQEVEQCQASLKHLLNNKNINDVSEITDNEFRFGKSVFGITNNNDDSINNFISRDSNNRQNDTSNIENFGSVNNENKVLDDKSEYNGLSDLEKIKRELSFASATKEIVTSRESNYSNETQAAKFYFSKSMQASPDKTISKSLGIKNSQVKRSNKDYDGENYFDNNLKISDCTQISMHKKSILESSRSNFTLHNETVNHNIAVIHEGGENENCSKKSGSKDSVTMGMRTNQQTLQNSDEIEGSKIFTLNNTTNFNNEKSFKFENIHIENGIKKAIQSRLENPSVQERYDLNDKDSENSYTNHFQFGDFSIRDQSYSEDFIKNINNIELSEFSKFSRTNDDLTSELNKLNFSDTSKILNIKNDQIHNNSESITDNKYEENSKSDYCNYNEEVMDPMNFMKKKKIKKCESSNTTFVKTSNGLVKNKILSEDVTVDGIFSNDEKSNFKRKHNNSMNSVSNIAQDIKKAAVVQDVLKDKQWKNEIDDELKINYKMLKMATNNLKMIKDMQIAFTYFKSGINSPFVIENQNSSCIMSRDNSMISRYYQMSANNSVENHEHDSLIRPCKGDYTNNYSIYALNNKHNRIKIENEVLKNELSTIYSIHI